MRRVEIGIAADDGVVGEDWVHVEGKTIVFEDGGKELVRPFLVRRDLVTVAEYEEFCAETGYKTVAELAGDEQTYLNSLEIYGVSRKAMKATAAKLFAFKDVVAYCRWKRARLPSEAEWLAAAIHDERILPMPKNPYQTMKLANEDKALNFVSFEFTSSTVMGQVVIRNGPKKVRFEEWNSEIHTFHHRRPIDPDEPNDDASIRLCRDIL